MPLPEKVLMRKLKKREKVRQALSTFKADGGNEKEREEGMDNIPGSDEAPACKLIHSIPLPP